MVEHRKISALAGFDRADLAFEVKGIGRTQRDCPQRAVNVDPFIVAQQPARCGQAIDRAPGHMQRPERRDRRIGMDGVRHADFLRRATRIHALRAIGPERHVVVRIAPVKMVIGKEVGTHAKRLHALQLRPIGHLAVLQREAVIG